MRLIKTYKEKIDELIGYTTTGEFVATQTRQLRVLQNLTSDALDQLEIGKPLPEIIEITSVSITSYSSCNIELAIKSDLPEDKVKALITNIVKNDTFNLYVDFINPDDDEMESLELKFKFYEFN